MARGIAAIILPALAEKPVEPIEDAEPETTAQLKETVIKAQQGEVDARRFTDEAQQLLVPRIQSDKDTLATFGRLKTFELLERQEQGDGVQLRSRATFEQETVLIRVALDESGLIRGIGLQPQA